MSDGPKNSPNIRSASQQSAAAAATSNNNSNTKRKQSSSILASAENPRPIPAMPSDLFQQLALSQLELLANSLRSPTTDSTISNTQEEEDSDQEKTTATPPTPTSPLSTTRSKIKSMALYLPQENVHTGQLEFLPAVVYPHPSSERVFIASDANSRMAPTLPKLLTKLPGFAAPNYLLPRYPMVSSSSSSSSSSSDPGGGRKKNNGRDDGEPPDLAGVGVGVVEEVLCDVRSGAPALSVPLFLGSQTVGVLLVSPAVPLAPAINNKNKSARSPHQQAFDKRSNTQKRKRIGETIWTVEDRDQIARAARTLAMALSMDMERSNLELRNERIQNALSDSLHQVKNPLQALRTFGKLLQRRVASVEYDEKSTNKNKNNNNNVRFDPAEVGTTAQLLELTRKLMEQSDRVVNLLAPIDSLVDSLDNGSQTKRRPLFYLNPSPSKENDPPSSSTTATSTTKKNQSLVPWDQAKPPALLWEADTIEFARRETPQTLALSRPRAVKTTANTLQTTSKPQSTTKVTSLTNSEDEDSMEMSFIIDVLEPILDVYAAMGEERGISFHVLGLDLVDELPGVFVRRKALQEAVSNVLDNAFKYVVLSKDWNGGRNPDPLVRVRLMPNNDNDDTATTRLPAGVTLIIEDNGPGVPAAEAGLIFERGFRSPSTSSLADGTGIGLDISRSLLERMGGRLECFVRTPTSHADSPYRPSLLDGGVFRILLFRDRMI